MITDTLQQLINKRAADKLDKDLLALAEVISSQPLLVYADTPQITIEYNGRPQKSTIMRFFCGADNNGSGRNGIRIYGEYLILLKEHWLPFYTERETKEFVAQIDTLSQEVGELKDEISNLQTD